MSDRDTSELIRQRLQKVEALRARGIEPFGSRYPVTHWAGSLAERLGAADDEASRRVWAALLDRLVERTRAGWATRA